MGLDRVEYRHRTAAVDILVEIHRDQRRRRADLNIARILGIDRQHVRRNDILPAMILELAHHDVPHQSITADDAIPHHPPH